MRRALAFVLAFFAFCVASQAFAQTTITFDTPSAPANFVDQSQPISTYSGALVFSNTTMKVLNEGGNFGVTGHSAPNFLAWNNALTNQSFTLTFPSPSSGISLRTGSSNGGNVTVTALNGSGTVLQTVNQSLGSALVTINITATNVSSLTFSTTAIAGVVDDVTFSNIVCGNGTIEGTEQCDDGNTNPGDCCSATCAFEPATTVCRAPVDVCDQSETCTGASATCPPDLLAADGTACGPAATCDGASSCQAGACTAGMPVDCDDADACTTDSCEDPGATCVHTPIFGCGQGGGGAGAAGGSGQGGASAGGSGEGGEASGEGGSGGRGDTSAVGLDDGGCDCRAASSKGSSRAAWALVALGLVALRRRRGAARVTPSRGAA